MSAVPRTGLSRYAYQGRHRTPDVPGTAVRTAALSAGVAAAVLAGTAAPATAAPSDDPWQRLRMCESGGNYRINTGNGYYGAYQFDAGTWRAYGGAGLPHQASPAEQDHRARLLYQARGWSPWPACSRKLGLGESPAYGVTQQPVVRRTTVPATVAGPGAVTVNRVYRISGTGRPKSRVVLRIRAGSGGNWLAYPRRTDAAGRFSTPWRATTDFQYQVLGETRSTIRTTKVAPTALAAAAATQRLAGGGGPAVTMTGTARPRSRVVIVVRSPKEQWRGWTVVTAGPNGRWTLRANAPSRGFLYYAKSSNGLRSTVRSIRL